MSDLLPFLVVGVTSGSVYAIAGMGLVLTYKTSGIFNFAHGAQAAAAAYLMYELRDVRGWPWPLAALVAITVAGVLAGFLLERLGYALRDASTANRIVATVGLLVGLQAMILIIYGPAVLPFPQFLPEQVVALPGVNVSASQIIVTLLALGAATGLYWFFTRARVGVAMQAVVEDPDLLSLQGVSPVGVRRTAWVIGSCFAAVSGLLLAPTIGLDAAILTLLVVQAFGAAAVGGFNNLPVTYAGGLMVGLLQSFASKAITDVDALRSLTALPPNMPFIVLFVALLVIPRRRLIERGRRTVQRARTRPATSPTTQLAGVAGGAVVLVLIPVLFSNRIPVFTNAIVFSIIFASLALLVRVAGMVSLCQLAFAAVGAAAFAHLVDAGVPWLPAVLVGGLAATPVGAFVAVPAIRLAGVYLAIATFGFGILMERLVYGTFLMFGRSQTLEAPRPSLGTMGLGTDTGYYYVVLAAAVAAAALAYAVRRARLGRLLRAMSESSIAVESHGANTNVTRLHVFCISAFLAGIAGALAGPITGSITAPTFTFQLSLLALPVLALAGPHPVASPFVAAGLLYVVPSFVSDSLVDYTQLFFAVAAVVVSIGPLALVGHRLARSTRARDRIGRSPVTARHRGAASAADGLTAGQWGDIVPPTLELTTTSGRYRSGR